MDDDRLASERDAVYGMPLDEFVEERDRRVKVLRDEGLREEAAALKSARKPTVPAWAVDRLARDRPHELGRLLDAGQELRDAQRRAASGRGAQELRAATRTVRDIVSDLRRRAEAILSDAGSSSSAHLEDVERTLFTAAVTPEHHDAVRRGVLERPLEGAGFGGVEGLLLLPPDDGGTTDDPPGRDDAEDAADPDAAAAERRREEERRREQERRRLERQAADLERSHRDQQRRADRSATKAEQLRTRADEATEAAAESQDEAERIAAELAAVRDELAELSRGRRA